MSVMDVVELDCKIVWTGFIGLTVTVVELDCKIGWTGLIGLTVTVVELNTRQLIP